VKKYTLTIKFDFLCSNDVRLLAARLMESVADDSFGFISLFNEILPRCETRRVCFHGRAIMRSEEAVYFFAHCQQALNKRIIWTFSTKPILRVI
jgi:hypothetical protein